MKKLKLPAFKMKLNIHKLRKLMNNDKDSFRRIMGIVNTTLIEIKKSDPKASAKIIEISEMDIFL